MEKVYYVDYGQGIKIPFYDVNTQSGIDNAIRYGMTIFPPEELVLFRPPFVNENDIVYDVGSYVGTHSILFALWQANVYSFEPSPFNYPRLIKNCAPFTNIHCFDVAFHEKEYDVLTRFKDCNSNSPLDLDKEQLIKYRILDKFIKDNNLSTPDFIKIDIEGMETVLFKTLDSLFKNNKTIIYVERHRKERGKPDVQNYKDNPNWLFPEEGGYDFNDLKNYDVDTYNFGKDMIMNKLGPNSDYNNLDEAIIILPRGKQDLIKQTNLKIVQH